MKRIFRTLNIILRQEKISLVVYSIATLLISFLTLRITPSINDSGVVEPVTSTLTMISMLSILVGLYIGSGFLRLRQSHLWFTHPNYRMNIMYSLIGAAIIYGFIQSLVLIHVGWSLPVSLVAPICMTLLTAQFVIASNVVMKFILPTTPFILFQLTNYEISTNSILLLLVVFTGLALYLNATNKSHSISDNLGVMSSDFRQQMKGPTMQKINMFSVFMMQTFNIKPSKGDFTEALIQPSNRYGIYSIIFALICLTLVFLVSSEKVEIEVFGILFLGSMMLSQFMDIQLHSKQTKPFAHLFSNEHHALFKHKTLSMLDKHITIQAVITILTLMLIGLFISDFVNSLILIKLGVTVILVARAFSPLMLCLDWFNINLKLISVVGLYAFTSVMFCRLLLEHSLDEQHGLFVLAGITLIVLIRAGSNYLWKRLPIEQFMRVYG